MSTIYRTVYWLLLEEPDAAVRQLESAIEAAGFSTVQVDGRNIVAEVPAAWFANRRRATLTGRIKEVPRGTEIKWTVQGPQRNQYRHVGALASHVPAELLFDHGIGAAAKHLAGGFFGRAEIRHLANLLDSHEMVLALGAGYRAGKLGIVALTEQRIIFLEKGRWSEDVVYIPLEAVQSVSLTAKPYGESLTVSHAGGKAGITSMGHGQAQKISRKLRERRRILLGEPRS